MFPGATSISTFPKFSYVCFGTLFSSWMKIIFKKIISSRQGKPSLTNPLSTHKLECITWLEIQSIKIINRSSPTDNSTVADFVSEQLRLARI